MSTYRYAALAATGVLLLLLVFSGCQNGSGSGPTLPLATDGSGTSLTQGTGPDGGRYQTTVPRTNCHHVWGLWSVVIDPVTLEVEVITLREGQWHANVVEFMQPPHPPGNIGFFVDEPASDIPNGLFAVDVRLRHPFPSLPVFRGFDVRGAFLADGNVTSQPDPGARFANPHPSGNEARLTNADGYMRWFNPMEFTLGGISILEYIPTQLGTSDNTTATLNPFKYFSDDFLSAANKDLPLQDVEVNPARRGTFSTSSSITRRYMIQFAMVGGNPEFKFSYVIDASYHDPDPGDLSYPVDSFPTSANMQEVYKVVCTDMGSTAYYVDAGSNGGDLVFDLELFDWQAPYNLSGVLGEIGGIIVESPTLLDNYGGMIDLTDTFKTNAAPSTVTSSVATVEILDVTPSGNRGQALLFTITSEDPSDYSNPFGSPYPTSLVLAAYYMWDVPVSNTSFNTPPQVGQVVGPDTVDGSEGPLNYSAPISDPEAPPQILTAMWSVVPTGNAASYVIPANPDLSVDIDWSGYAEGAYDVNVEVADGMDSTEGTLLTVTKTIPNTPPTVGQVTGDNPVTVADTSATYSAPISDPEAPPQVLIVNWSVVATGNSHVYSIPAEPDYSLDQDWSTYDVGDYDVNVEVDDGVAPPVEGTQMTVTLNNTLPILGAITGKNPVDESDSSEQYNHGTLTDPDNNQTYTYMWSLQPDGSPANFNISPNGSNDSLVVDWCDYPVGQYDMQVQVSDGYGTGNSPVFDVVRGLSACSGNAHEWYGDSDVWPSYSYLGHIPPGWPGASDPIVLDSYMLPRMDMDFFASGAFAGEGIIQGGPNVLMNFVADSTGVSDPTTSYEWRIPGMSFYDPVWTEETDPPDTIPCSPRSVISLDTSPDLDSGDGYDDNRIVFVTSHDHDLIYVIDADSTNPDDPPIATLSNVSGAEEIPCIAIDEDDDIWALVLGSDNNFRLYHWTYILDDNTGGPYYTFEAGDTLNLTTQLGSQTDVYDMVVAFTNDHLYILEAGPNPYRGIIHEVDISSGSPSYVTSQNNIFSSSMETSLIWNYLVWNGSDSDIHNFAYGADISIDHVGVGSCEPEHCRLEVMGKLTTDAIQCVRLDLDLNILNRQNGGGGDPPLTFLCYGLSTDSNTGDRVLVCPPYAINPEYDPLGYPFFFWSPPAGW